MIGIVTSVTLSLIVILVQLMTYEHTSIRTVFHAPVCLSVCLSVTMSCLKCCESSRVD